MKKTTYIIAIFSILAIVGLNSCDDSFPIGELANNSDRLVIEGIFTNENRVQTIRISRTLAFTKPSPDGNSYPKLTGAQVSVSDDQGNTFAFIEQTPGLYATNGPVQGVAGRYYTLNITTSEGKQYVSSPESMQAAVPIKELKAVERDADDLGVFSETLRFVNLKFDDPQGTNNYYRWYWKESPQNNFTVLDTSYTTSFDEDRLYDGTELDFELTGLFNDDTRHFKLYQASITQGAYDFFRQLDAQQSGGGAGPFSPPPSPVRGNITNKNDARDFALGYFVVAGVTSAQIEITQ